jgi:hypothetical protein
LFYFPLRQHNAKLGRAPKNILARVSCAVYFSLDPVRALLIVTCLIAATIARAADEDADLTKKLQLIIGEVKLVQPGMTRGDLLRFFTIEGGFSTRKHRRYVERRCPYIKVDVEFDLIGQAAGPSGESSADIIKHISEPFLQLTIGD